MNRIKPSVLKDLKIEEIKSRIIDCAKIKERFDEFLVIHMIERMSDDLKEQPLISHKGLIFDAVLSDCFLHLYDSVLMPMSLRR